ncbi:MAG: RNA polymerase sigma-54 factor [Cytophagia bacterium]|nr:RNA polymerase sigma-54 factor [Cytophagia bacterium]
MMQRLILKQSQSQKLSPQQIQFIKLLQLSNSNIESEIKKELEDNPALEEKVILENNDGQEIENQVNYNYSKQSSKQNNNFSKERNLSNDESFIENLQTQVSYLNLKDEELIIAKQIIGTLDNDGYLRRNLESIIDDIAFSENIEFNINDIKGVLKKIQTLEPAGVAARNLEECLLLQINRKKSLSRVENIAKKIITDTFEYFKNKQFDKIYEKYNVDKKILNKSFDYIKSLNPKPTGGHDDSNLTEYLIPDFIIKKENNELNVFLSSENKTIGINKSYINIYDNLKNKKNKNKENRKSYDFIKQKIQSAQWFVDAINQRNNTLLKTMKTIVDLQKKFFEDGDENELKPMILKDIANVIKMDISTVSRIVRSKVAQTEYGVFPLKYFFSESTIKKGDDLVSSKVVKNKLLEIIESEDKSKPYSDEQLENKLKENDFEVARRTVSKYREQLKIPVARLRKNY